MSRAEAHADAPAHRVRESLARVVRALERHAVGRANALSGAALAARVPVAETTVRDVIAELRDDPDGPPIGNYGDGYYVIDSPSALDDWVADVKDEIATKRERVRANVKAFNRREYGP